MHGGVEPLVYSRSSASLDLAFALIIALPCVVIVTVTVKRREFYLYKHPPLPENETS